jgi:hypothetical protein
MKSALAASVMGIAGGMVLHGKLWHTDGNTLDKAFYLVGTVSGCAIIYFLVSYLLKNEELSYVMNILKQKFRK